MSERNPIDDETYRTISRLCEGDPDDHITELWARRPDDEVTGTQRAIFEALGDEDRLRILAALRDGECCACELQVVVDAPRLTVASHLRALREVGLVRSRKKGKWIHYRIADTAVFDLLDLAASMENGE